MENRLKGKRTLITGATSGIGKASARKFASMQSHLIITGRRSDRLESLKKELEQEHNIKVTTGVFDIRDREACRRFVDSLEEPVDILVNNAGLASGKDPVDQADFDDWDVMIDTNLKGLLSMIRFVSPQMKQRNSGHIINIGSIAGHEAYPGGSVYCATKHGVKAITESAKKDLHGTNIRVSMVSPGLVDTEFSEVRFDGDREQAEQVYEGIKPLNGTDIAEIIVFIANRPAHVNIMDTIVFPVAQSSATMVHRDR